MKCKNCYGSHATKDCLEKPSIKKQKSNKSILTIVKKKESYEEKRDPFKNYDNDMYLSLVNRKKHLVATKEDIVQEEIDVEAEEYTNYDPSSRSTSHTYRKRQDVAEYLKPEIEENESDYIKPKGIEELAWERK